MTTLADLLNSPTEFRHAERVYLLREPTLMECGEYQRWLEQEARAGAARAMELDEADRRRLLADVQRDIASQVYAWGGEACVYSLRAPTGIAKLLAIVCRDQGVTYELALEMVRGKLLEISALMLRAAESGDPDEKKAVGELLTRQGLPADFLNTSSADSPTTPTAAPPI